VRVMGALIKEVLLCLIGAVLFFELMRVVF
jgi:hypothetical protein